MLEAKKDYGVRVIRAYENKRRGDVIFPSGILRQQLLRARFVERVAPPTHIEPMSAETTRSIGDSIPEEFRRSRRNQKPAD